MEPVNQPTLIPNIPTTNPPQDNKKILFIAIGAGVLIMILLLFLFFIFLAPKQQKQVQNDDTNTTEQEQQKRLIPSPTPKDNKLVNSPIYKESFEIYPGQAQNEAKIVIPSKFIIQSNPGENGTTNLTLVSTEPDIIMPNFTLTPGQKLFMVAPLLKQTIPDPDLGDIYFVVVDENGRIVK